MTRIHDMAQLGQSIWYDQLSRSLLQSGGLRRMITEDGLLGMTTNPAIFEKSIIEGKEYGADLARMAREGASTFEIYDALVIDDVRNAAREFAAVYERTGGNDGFVSIEVNPELAHDTENTLKEARRLRRTLAMPNIMIKVPATDAGIPAVETLISEGVNVNVTLIFSIDVYRRVAEAYMRGVLARHAAGKDVTKVRSVASFFVSRIDTAIDKMLESKPGGDALMGRAAVANARLAYDEFKRLFADASFRSTGAAMQRPLWASTGTKNPAYSDVKYVDELIGRDTVNTIPPATYSAFIDHGAPKTTVEDDIAGMRRLIEQLGSIGISLDAVTTQLTIEGVEAFVKSFKNLLNVLNERVRGCEGTRVPG